MLKHARLALLPLPLLCGLAKPATAQDIETVEIETNAARVQGLPGTDYVIAFTVTGDAALLSASVRPPGSAVSTPLTFDPGESAFLFESAVFNSLAALRAQYPLGNYLVEFNGGATSISLNYADFEPPGFANLAFPQHLGLSSSTPTFTWSVCGGCNAGTGLDISLDNESTDTSLFELTFIPATAGTIAMSTSTANPAPRFPLPPQLPLVAGDTYVIGLDVVSGALSFPSVGADVFEYQAFFRNDLDAVFFGAGPEFLCNGDGGNQLGCTDCPCANNAIVGTVGGCLNSADTSAQLQASGSTSVSLPTGDTTDLRFALAGAPPTAFCILNSGDAVAPANMGNPCFGLDTGALAAVFDGLRCAVQNTLRHGGRAADSNGDVGITNNPWGGEGGPPVGIANAGAGFASGQTRYFQVINRDDPLQVCMRGLNTSQAVEVTFTP